MQTSARATYHHGNLRQAILDAAGALVQEVGVEAMTLRAAARRAGVSSGAPFRHFATKRDLVLALAEEGMARLRQAIETTLAAAPHCSAPARLALLGAAYVDWAADNPAHYRVLGDRLLIDFYHSQALLDDNRWISATMRSLLDQGQQAGLLRPVDPAQVNLQMRALAYGLARMMVDGHFAEFAVEQPAIRQTMVATIDSFLCLLAIDGAALADEIARARAAPAGG